MRQSSEWIRLEAALLGLLFTLALFSGGCGLGNSGLTTNLPQGGNGGIFEITTNSLVDAVAGRAYAATVATNGGSGALASCTLLGGSLPPADVLATTLQGSSCVIHYVPEGAVTNSTLRFTVKVTDTSIPANFDTRTYSIFVRPPFVLNQPSLAAGVQGRSYGTPSPFIQIVQSNAVAKAPASAVNQASEFGNGPLSACGIQSVTPINPGLQAKVDPGSPNRCLLESSSLTAAGTYQVTIAAMDSPILDPVTGQPAVQPGTATQTLTLVVNPPLSLVATLGSATAPDAVQGRSYGNVSAGFVEPTYAASGGIGPYIFTTPPAMANPSANGVPAGVACLPMPANTAVACSSNGAPVAGAPGTYPFTVSVIDTGNSAAPPSSSGGVPVAVAQSLTVHPPLSVSFSQNGVANPSQLLDAVVGRSYGLIGAAPSYTFAGGVGAVSWCVNSGTLTSLVGLSGISFNCSAPTIANSASLAASQVNGPPNTYNFTVQTSDAGDAAVPGAAVVTGSTGITVHPALATTLTQNGIANPSILLNSVQGQSYGTINNSQGAPTLAGNGGFGSSTYLWCINTAVPGFTSLSNRCGTATSTKAASALFVSAAAGAAGTYNNLIFELDDAGNAAVPSTFSGGGGATTPPARLTILQPLSLSVGTIYAGISGRAYGQGSGCNGGPCAPVTYTAANGLGGYNFTTVSAPAGFGCQPAGSTKYSCSAATASTGGTLSVKVEDTANASTPSSSGSLSNSITVNAVLSLKLTQNSVTDPSQLLDAVAGRSYGVIGATGAATYTPSGGSGNYLVCISSGPGNLPPSGVTGISADCTHPTTGSGPFSLSASQIPLSVNTGTTPVPFSFTITLEDGGNAGTPACSSPSCSASVSTAVNVDPALQLSSNLVASQFDAVNGRTYGTAGGGTDDLTFTASGGLTPYTITPNSSISSPGNGFPQGITCAQSSATLDCTSGAGTVSAAAGSYNIAATANDTGNVATPSAQSAGQTAGFNSTIKVYSEIAIQNSFLENAVEGLPYSAILQATGGVGAYIWLVKSGGIPNVAFLSSPPFSYDDANFGYYQGLPSLASPVPTQCTVSSGFSSLSKPLLPATCTVTLQVKDAGDDTVPSCTTISGGCPSFPASVKVFPRLGYVATYASNSGEKGDTLVEFYSEPQSGSFGASNVLTSVSLDTNSTLAENPVTPAVTPDAAYIYVTKQGDTHDVSVASASSTVNGCTTPGTSGCSASDLANNSIEASNTGTFNPTTMDVTPQRPVNSSSETTNVAYDAWLVDPTSNNYADSSVEPIPGAQSPSTEPAQLSSSLALNLPNANAIAISPDGSRAYVTLSNQPFGDPSTALDPSFAVINITGATQTPPTAATIVSTSSLEAQLSSGKVMRTDAVAADPRGIFAYAVEEQKSGGSTIMNIAVIKADMGADTYSLATVFPSSGTALCTSGGISGLAVLPDATRLYAVCTSDDTVHVYDVSEASASATGFGNLLSTITLGASCTTPVDIKPNAAGTRLFVSCMNSDTIIPVTIQGSTLSGGETYTVESAVSTDPTTGLACGSNGSCPQTISMTPNPALHITTGGDNPAQPVTLTGAKVSSSYAAYVVAAGGTVPRQWSDVSNSLGQTGACAGLSLAASSGEITGVPTTSGTCIFTLRVSDGSSPAQFVERQFSISVAP